MAKCERKPAAPVPVEYILTLTEEEAQVLQAVIVWVRSPNHQAGAINEALRKAGLDNNPFKLAGSPVTIGVSYK